jgi:hypothetical protein
MVPAHEKISAFLKYRQVALEKLLKGFKEGEEMDRE